MSYLELNPQWIRSEYDQAYDKIYLELGGLGIMGMRADVAQHLADMIQRTLRARELPTPAEASAMMDEYLRIKRG